MIGIRGVKESRFWVGLNTGRDEKIGEVESFNFLLDGSIGVSICFFPIQLARASNRGANDRQGAEAGEEMELGVTHNRDKPLPRLNLRGLDALGVPKFKPLACGDA